jgi:hypothetical protein
LVKSATPRIVGAFLFPGNIQGTIRPLTGRFLEALKELPMTLDRFRFLIDSLQDLGGTEKVENPACKLLLIDSDPAETALACKLLGEAFSGCKLVVVTDAVAFSEQLAIGGFSVVISEQSLGWALGMDVLAAFCRHHPHIHTILFTAANQLEKPQLQRDSYSLTCLQKNSAGFLKLVDVVGAALREDTDNDAGSGFSNSGVKCLDEANSPAQSDGSLMVDDGAAESDLLHVDRLFRLRRQLAEVFHNWRIENKKRHFKDEEKLLDREVAFLDEEFQITWDEKRELHVLAEQQAQLNARYLQTTPQLPVDPDDFLARTVQINSAKTQVIDNFRRIRDKNQIKHCRDKSAIPAG